MVRPEARRARWRRASAGVSTVVSPPRRSGVWACALASSQRGSLNLPRLDVLARPAACALASSQRGSLNMLKGSTWLVEHQVRAGVEPARESQRPSSATGRAGRWCALASSQRGSLNRAWTSVGYVAPCARWRRASAGVSTAQSSYPVRRRRGVRAGVEPARESQHLMGGAGDLPARGARWRRASAGVSTPHGWSGRSTCSGCALASSQRGSLNGTADVPAEVWAVCALASSQRGSLNAIYNASTAGTQRVRAGVEPARESQHRPETAHRGPRARARWRRASAGVSTRRARLGARRSAACALASSQRGSLNRLAPRVTAWSA